MSMRAQLVFASIVWVLAISALIAGHPQLFGALARTWFGALFIAAPLVATATAFIFEKEDV